MRVCECDASLEECCSWSKRGVLGGALFLQLVFMYVCKEENNVYLNWFSAKKG